MLLGSIEYALGIFSYSQSNKIKITKVQSHLKLHVALLFYMYVHCKHLRSCRDGQLT